MDVSEDASDKLASSWANPYQNRSNGGIPCFSEERSLERAAKVLNRVICNRDFIGAFSGIIIFNIL